MSHVMELKLKDLPGEELVTDLEALKTAVASLGGVWHEGKHDPKWWGRDMKDSAWPEWLTEDMMDRFDHAFSFPGVRYEVGVVRRGGVHHVVYDWIDAGLAKKLGGPSAELLGKAYVGARKQAQAVRTLIRTAHQQGYGVVRKTLDSGKIQITVRM